MPSTQPPHQSVRLNLSDCEKHGCQLPLKLGPGLVSGWMQPTSHARINPIIRESALAGGAIFCLAKRLWPEKRNFLKYLPKLVTVALAADALVISTAGT